MKKLTLLTLIFTTFSLVAQGNDWAQFGRYQDQNQALSQRPTVVFIGNSITDSWVDSIPDFFNENNFVGRGISGQVSSQMLVRFQEDVINLHPDVVVILCGTNDIAQNNGYISHEHIIQNIKSMCELARYHKIKPIVCSVLPAKAFRWRPGLTPAEDIRLLNEMIKALANEYNIPYVNYYSALADEEGGLPLKYSKDGVHPNKNGYIVMQNVIMPVLNKAVRLKR